MPNRAALVPATMVVLALSTAVTPPARDDPSGFAVRKLRVGREPCSVEIADVNRDGKSDLLVANAGSHDVTVLLGDGRGGFTPAPLSPFPAGKSPNDVAVADLNHDGNPDLVFANHDTSYLTVLFGEGRGDIVTADSADGSVTLFLSESTAEGRAERPASAPASAPAAASAGVSFPKDVQPLLARRCQPCHFPGGKMYERLPFDDPATVRRLGEKLFTRIRDEKERNLLKAWFVSTP